MRNKYSAFPKESVPSVTQRINFSFIDWAYLFIKDLSGQRIYVLLRTTNGKCTNVQDSKGELII